MINVCNYNKGNLQLFRFGWKRYHMSRYLLAKCFWRQNWTFHLLLLFHDQLHLCTNYSQVEFLIKLLEKKESIFVFMLCGSIVTLNSFLMSYLMMISQSTWSTNIGSWCHHSNENDIGNQQDRLSNSGEWTAFPKNKLISSTNKFISRSQSKILWNINLNLLAIVSFFHQRKNRRTVNNICSMFKIRVTKILDTLTDIFDKFKIIKMSNSLVLYRNPVLFCVRLKDTFVFTFKMIPIFFKCSLTDSKTTLIENLNNVYFVAF